MPRIARCVRAGAVHHVISRFVDRSWFFRDDEERDMYLRLVARALGKSDWQCLAYCLMSNHVHFAFVAGARPLASWALRVHAPFARWLNARHGRLGPVFADRPAAYHVPPHRVGDVLAYIHNNPVRARIVAVAGDSAWSSHRAYVVPSQRAPWLRVDQGLALAGCDQDPTKFHALVASRGGQLVLPELEPLRNEARRMGPVELGTPSLVEPVVVPIVARAFAATRPAVEDVARAVRALFAISASTLSRPYTRGAIRRTMIHACANVGISLSDAAAATGVSRQRACVVFGRDLSDDERNAVDEIVRAVGKG